MSKQSDKYLKSKAYKKWKADVEALHQSLQPKKIPWYTQLGVFILAWGLWALLWLGIFWACGDVLKGLPQ